jgi:hypothetical protein
LGYKGKMTGPRVSHRCLDHLNELGFRGDVIERQVGAYERNEVRGA